MTMNNEITYNNFEISLVVFMSNITTNHATTYTNSLKYNFFLQYPVVLENCTFHKPAMKWTVNYLKENLKDEDHTAYFSKDR